MGKATCYYSANQTVWQSPDYVVPYKNPSSPHQVVNCCGDGDFYLSNHLCVNRDTYYLSPCTDSTYKSSVCPKYCQHRTDKNQLDVRYDPRDKKWHCCTPVPSGNDAATCYDFTGETFDGPPPSELTVQHPIKMSSLPGFVPTGLPAAVLNGPSGGSHLSTNAIVGIVFGVLGSILTVAGFLVALGIYRTKLRRRREAEKKLYAGEGRSGA